MQSKTNSPKKSSLFIALIYAAFGGLWILYSDKILAALVNNAETISKIQTIKGWTYVAVTALLVFFLVRSMEKKLHGYMAMLEEKNHDLKAACDEAIRKEKEISELMKDVERKNEELESVINVSSHDLRSPLVNIVGFSGELMNDCEFLDKILGESDIEPEANKKMAENIIKEKIPESIDFITSSIRRMENLQRSLLKICRLGAMILHPECLDMNALMRQAVDSLKYLQEKNSAVIDIHDLPPCKADRSQLLQVFTNLIENALKHRKKNVPCKIEISGKRQQDKVIYSVKDNGIGIDKNYYGKIFELFHRLEPEGDIESQGVGLTVVRRIVSRHNGSVWVESEIGKGSSFYISLQSA